MREVLDAMNANFVGKELIQEMLSRTRPATATMIPYADSIAKDVDSSYTCRSKPKEQPGIAYSRRRPLRADHSHVPSARSSPILNGRVAVSWWLTVPPRRTALTITA